ncbi:hypothetical protein KIL84_021739 [Mauremys mutica]|uniref:Uncharacterized protein n=1 Tax=Mauremys mutica TaxID=74926 RepID=A0A9D3XGB7_9SAUR|nr:hypothetical protein KIL84_021739 [Mauremys mutica]
MSVPTRFGMRLELYFCTLEVYLSVHLKNPKPHRQERPISVSNTEPAWERSSPAEPLGLPGRTAIGGKETSLTSNQENRRVWGDDSLSTHEWHKGHGNTERKLPTSSPGAKCTVQCTVHRFAKSDPVCDG